MPRPKKLTEKQRLLADLDAARAALGGQWRSATEWTRPAALLQTSLRRHRFWWAAGALVAGFAVVRALRRPSKRKNGRDTPAKSAKTGKMLALIATPLFGMARKALLSLAAKQFQFFMQSPVKPQRPL